MLEIPFHRIEERKGLQFGQFLKKRRDDANCKNNFKKKARDYYTLIINVFISFTASDKPISIARAIIL